MKTWNPEAVRLAQIAHDESIEPIKRMMAMVQVNSMLEAGTLIVDVPGDINDLIDKQTVERESKEKYIWRNGARVKVKS